MAQDDKMLRPNRKKNPPQARWTREEYLLDALDHYETLARKAEVAKSWNAAVKAKDSARLVRDQLDQLRETESRAADAAALDLEGHTEEILGETRRLRLGATAAGSYVAASKLIEQEQSLLKELREERRQAEIDQMMEEDLGAIVSEISTLIKTLPDALLEELKQAIHDRENPTPPDVIDVDEELEAALEEAE